MNNLSPIGDKLPGNETQTRPLVPLSPPVQRKIWKEFLATGMEMNARNIKTFINERKAKEDIPPDHTDQISDEYMAAVNGMMAQIRYAKNDQWQKTSYQSALLWHRVMQEAIVAREGGNGTDT